MLRDPRILERVPAGGWTPTEVSGELQVSKRQVYNWLSRWPVPRKAGRWLLSREYLAERMGLGAVQTGTPSLDLEESFFQVCRRDDPGGPCILDDWRLRLRPDLLAELARELGALIAREIDADNTYLVPGNIRDRGAYACPCVQVFSGLPSIFPVPGDRGSAAVYPRPEWNREGPRPHLVYVDAVYGHGTSVLQTHAILCQWVRRSLPEGKKPRWRYPHVAAVAVFYSNDPRKRTFRIEDRRHTFLFDDQKEPVPILRLITCRSEDRICELGPWS